MVAIRILRGGVRLQRLCGKYLIPPFSKKKSGLWGFASDKPEEYVDFIIEVNEGGDDVLHTPNPETLENSFGKNPRSPNYLTPVFFSRDVLDKYYNQPSKYAVEDGYLRCGDLWGIRIDNHHDDKVIAWLGDLVETSLIVSNFIGEVITFSHVARLAKQHFAEHSVLNLQTQIVPNIYSYRNTGWCKKRVEKIWVGPFFCHLIRETSTTLRQYEFHQAMSKRTSMISYWHSQRF
jgi:hypothetical protein